MNGELFLEGGGDSKDGLVRCRKGFRILLEKCGLKDRMPRLHACGGRRIAFEDFQLAHKAASGKYIGMLIDSEEPIIDPELTWQHLSIRKGDEWTRPEKAADDQVLLMATSMETWIAADRAALKRKFGKKFNEKSLPKGPDFEKKSRQEVYKSLTAATKSCGTMYAKGDVSFSLLEELDPNVLESLPSFKRAIRILKEKLS